MNGGITEYIKWKARLKKLVCIPTQRYNAPSQKSGTRFFGILYVELDEVCASKWNMEKVIVFKSVILQRAPGANSYAQIRKRILFGLDFWNCGVFDKLVKDTYNLLWDALEHLAGIKWRSNVVEGPQTSS